MAPSALKGSRMAEMPVMARRGRSMASGSIETAGIGGPPTMKDREGAVPSLSLFRVQALLSTLFSPAPLPGLGCIRIAPQAPLLLSLQKKRRQNGDSSWLCGYRLLSL